MAVCLGRQSQIISSAWQEGPLPTAAEMCNLNVPPSPGWGLPFCFTAAAGFRHGRLAAIDSVCMIHPARDPPGGQ